jgi:flavin-dependent dehydrogenase
MKRILIVGGVAGGANAAARARRLDESVDIVVFERGPYVSFANCGLPYHVGGEIQDESELLLHTPQSLKGRFNLDVRVRSEVVAIDRTPVPRTKNATMNLFWQLEEPLLNHLSLESIYPEFLPLGMCLMPRE